MYYIESLLRNISNKYPILCCVFYMYIEKEIMTSKIICMIILKSVTKIQYAISIVRKKLISNHISCILCYAIVKFTMRLLMQAIHPMISHSSSYITYQLRKSDELDRFKIVLNKQGTRSFHIINIFQFKLNVI